MNFLLRISYSPNGWKSCNFAVVILVLPKIQANQAGAADALMLDAEGYVSETNATNVFMVKKGIVSTPLPDYCLPGIAAYFMSYIILKQYKWVNSKRLSDLIFLV